MNKAIQNSTESSQMPQFEFPSWPIWGEAERNELLSALESGHWAGNRAMCLPKFSKDFSRYHDSEFGIPLFNGTVTLESALIACGIGEGDEVIVPAITFISTASAVLRVNATPVVVDVNPGSMCIDPAKVEAAITPSTKAVMAVHVGGVMCDMDSLVQLCQGNNISLVEDCAHAHGSAWKGQKAGSFGKFGSFSFQHSKLMSSGEGGFLVSNDSLLIDKAWNYANCGREKGKDVYFHSSLGTNYRMTEWQAAILSAQLLRYPEQLAAREKAAMFLDEEISSIEGLMPQARDKRMTQQGHYCYVFHVDPQVYGNDGRDKFFSALTEAGVPLSLPYPPINKLDLFQSGKFPPTIRNDRYFDKFEVPSAQRVFENTIWIHHRALLSSEENINQLIDFLKKLARSSIRRI